MRFIIILMIFPCLAVSNELSKRDLEYLINFDNRNKLGFGIRYKNVDLQYLMSNIYVSGVCLSEKIDTVASGTNDDCELWPSMSFGPSYFSVGKRFNKSELDYTIRLITQIINYTALGFEVSKTYNNVVVFCGTYVEYGYRHDEVVYRNTHNGNISKIMNRDLHSFGMELRMGLGVEL